MCKNICKFFIRFELLYQGQNANLCQLTLITMELCKKIKENEDIYSNTWDNVLQNPNFHCLKHFYNIEFLISVNLGCTYLIEVIFVALENLETVLQLLWRPVIKGKNTLLPLYLGWSFIYFFSLWSFIYILNLCQSSPFLTLCPLMLTDNKWRS